MRVAIYSDASADDGIREGSALRIAPLSHGQHALDQG
jgi:hypothetical protein